MSGLWRLAATIVVWIAPALIVSLAEPYRGDIVWLTLILAAAATFSTRYIWQGQATAHTAESRKVSKAKRTNHVTRLMDVLDEDELDDLEAWLDARRDRRLADQELIDYGSRT